MESNEEELPPQQRDELLTALKARFETNPSRHPGLVWAEVQARLDAKPDKWWSLSETERTGGEPDIVGVKSSEFVLMDCLPERPAGHRRLPEALLPGPKPTSRGKMKSAGEQGSPALLCWIPRFTRRGGGNQEQPRLSPQLLHL